MVTVQQIRADQFDETVRNADVVVEFFATWCGACRRMEPVLEAVSADLAGKVEFVKVNVEHHPELAARFDVRSTPTLILFRDGTPLGGPLVGARPEAIVREAITAAFAAPNGGAATPNPAQAWVPVDACTLPTEEQPFRLAEFAGLFTESVSGIERPDRTRLRLEIDADATDRAQDLAAREGECCAFFRFDFHPSGDGKVWMQVGVPAERSSVLDGIAAQAAEAAGLGAAR